MTTLHVTAKMIAAGTRSLYNHAKADPERTVVAVFIAMMQARSEMPEVEVRMATDERQRRN
jgi:hypothetical protein